MRREDFIDGFPGTLADAEFLDKDIFGHHRPLAGLVFIPHLLPPSLKPSDLHGRLFEVLDRAREALVRLDSLVDGLPSRTTLLAAMRVSEAQASSRIENTVASLDDIAMAAAMDRRATSETLEVVRNRDAIVHGLNSPLPVSVRLVREMHSILITDPAQRPGMLRDRQVYIGSSTLGITRARFVPPPADRVASLMDDWERFCNPGPQQRDETPSRQRFSDLVELAMAHYQFETIHPFNDGNGRLGRALISLAPVKQGHLRNPVCNVSEWIQGNRQEYYDRLLAVSTRGEWDEWITFFCTALAEQATTDTRRARALHDLYTTYLRQITMRRGSILPVRLLDHIFDRMGVTVAIAAEIMDVSRTQAQRHIDTFVTKGILEPVKGIDYGRIYLAKGVIRALSDTGDASAS